jgi:hypothetical protein
VLLLLEEGVQFLKLDAVSPGSDDTRVPPLDNRQDVAAWSSAIDRLTSAQSTGANTSSISCRGSSDSKARSSSSVGSSDSRARSSSSVGNNDSRARNSNSVDNVNSNIGMSNFGSSNSSSSSSSSSTINKGIGGDDGEEEWMDTNTLWLTISWKIDPNYAADFAPHANAWRTSADVDCYCKTLSSWQAVRNRFREVLPWLGWLPKAVGTVRVFRKKFTLEDAIGSHACSLQALAGV